MHGISGHWIAGNLLLLNFTLLPCHAAVWYVAPQGDDSDPGTRERPFATPQRAQEAVSAGDTVWLRGGAYKLAGPRNAGWVANKSGFALRHVPQNITTAHESWGIWCSGSDNVFEALDIHHIQGPGLFIAGGGNLALNCDSHHNYDPKSSNGAGEDGNSKATVIRPRSAPWRDALGRWLPKMGSLIGIHP